MKDTENKSKAQPIKETEEEMQKQRDKIDITERKQAENNIRESEQFMTSLFESVQDGISVLKPDLTIRHVNGVMKKWYKENLPLDGKKCYEVYHNADKPCDPCPTLRCLESGKTEWSVVPGLPGSSIEWIELYSYPIKDSNSGKITGVVEFVRDITLRKKVEEALRESEVKYRNLFTQIADPIFIFDKGTHCFLDCNQSGLDRYGYTLGELRNMTPHQLHPPEEHTKVDKNIKDEGATSPHCYTHVTKGGEAIQVEVSTAPIEFKGQEAWISIVRDITERKQAEVELERHRAHLEELVKERTAELEEKNAELERYNQLFVGREYRIKELKEKVKELEGKASSK